MKTSSAKWFFVLLVFILPVAAYALVAWYRQSVEPLPVLGSKGHQVENFQLLNQNGETKTRSEWDNRIVVANFFFTHCPVICPKMTMNLKKLQEKYAGDDAILINSFTVDPERDSSARLKEYSRRFGINNPNWQLLTGDKKVIYKLARNSFMIVATDGDGGPDDFIHSEKLVLIDKEKRIRGYYNGTDDAEVSQLIHDIKRLENEK